MSKFDQLYKSLVLDVIHNGTSNHGQSVRTKYVDGSPAYTISKQFKQIEIDTSEVPILTTKSVLPRLPITELLWIWQQKTSDTAYLNEHNNTIWKEWTGEDNTIGKAYGHQLAKKVYGELDQVDYVLHELKNNSMSRRIITDIWNVDDLSEMNLTPCVYNTQWLVEGDKLNLQVNQRSVDLALGFPFNAFQYYALHNVFAHLSGLKQGRLVWNLGDYHIYDRHIELLQQQVNGVEHNAATLEINHHDSWYDYQPSDFKLINYKHNGKFTYEVAI